MQVILQCHYYTNYDFLKSSNVLQKRRKLQQLEYLDNEKNILVEREIIHYVLFQGVLLVNSEKLVTTSFLYRCDCSKKENRKNRVYVCKDKK